MISGWLGNFSVRLFFTAETADEFITADRLDIAISVITIISAVLVLILINQITNRQDEKRRRLQLWESGSTI